MSLGGGRRLKRGDLIEFHRDIFNHWGLYLDNNLVVHVTCCNSWPHFNLSSSSNEGNFSVAVRSANTNAHTGENKLRPNPEFRRRSPTLPERQTIATLGGAQIEELFDVAGGREFCINNELLAGEKMEASTMTEILNYVAVFQSVEWNN
ncbi:hypothetical protein BV898_02360 [Hypsibius exemplaris]|uniref:LRAT domain-containing protein n=1 Tax=Hypsibius exemplaris TaxID=2072580 RepID=A0A1W0X7W0_HYPEX|nr:hypothetical protein BV898_02360 [Hypsibius exemplaris]